MSVRLPGSLRARLVIGAITCYQILFNEIVDRIKQYATLKAMGFSNAFLRRIILEQALLLSCGARFHTNMGIVIAVVHLTDFLSVDAGLRVRRRPACVVSACMETSCWALNLYSTEKASYALEEEEARDEDLQKPPWM